jgi:hypothetical protein
MGLAFKCSEIHTHFVPCLLYMWVHMHSSLSSSKIVCTVSTTTSIQETAQCIMWFVGFKPIVVIQCNFLCTEEREPTNLDVSDSSILNVRKEVPR